MGNSAVLYEITAPFVFNALVLLNYGKSFFFLEFLQFSSVCIVGNLKKLLVRKYHLWVFVQLQVCVLVIEGVLVFGPKRMCF